MVLSFVYLAFVAVLRPLRINNFSSDTKAR
jgi:hypothetical protein